MILGKRTWRALAVCAAAVLLLNLMPRTNSVHEQLLSARVYWNAQVAIVTLTTVAEVHRESWAARLTRAAAAGLGMARVPQLYVGIARVIVLRDGQRTEWELPPPQSPAQLPLWPYFGHLYTWETQGPVRAWNGQTLTAVPPLRADELLRAFPHERDNFLPSASPTDPDILQDAITREEWHAYQHLADLPDGARVVFAAAREPCEIIVTRGADGGPGLALLRGGRIEMLWRPQAAAHRVSEGELAAYRRRLPRVPLPGGRRWHGLRVALALAAMGLSLMALTALLTRALREGKAGEESRVEESALAVGASVAQRRIR